MTIVAAVSLALASGCGATREVRVENAAGFARMFDGPTAVLRVSADRERESKAAYMAWGVVHNTNPALSFAEKVADAAREYAGLAVISPAEAACSQTRWRPERGGDRRSESRWRNPLR